MVKSVFASLSPEEQRAPPPPEDDGDAMNGDLGVSAEQLSSGDAGLSKEAEQAAVVASLDMAPCGAVALPEESADSSCDAADAALGAVGVALPATPMLAVWLAAAVA